MEKDDRYRLEKTEYLEIANSVGLDANDAEQALTQLKQHDLIISFPNVPKYVYIHPSRVENQLLTALDVNNEQTEKKIELCKIKRNEYIQKYDQLTQIKQKIDNKARASVTRWLWGGVGFLVIQGSLVARLTWWELSWDVMEPITYLLNFSSSILILLYFCFNKLDFTYPTMYENLYRNKQLKFYKKEGFDLDEYHQVERNIDNLRTDLVILGCEPNNI